MDLSLGFTGFKQESAALHAQVKHHRLFSVKYTSMWCNISSFLSKSLRTNHYSMLVPSTGNAKHSHFCVLYKHNVILGVRIHRHLFYLQLWKGGLTSISLIAIPECIARFSFEKEGWHPYPLLLSLNALYVSSVPFIDISECIACNCFINSFYCYSWKHCMFHQYFLLVSLNALRVWSPSQYSCG